MGSEVDTPCFSILLLLSFCFLNTPAKHKVVFWIIIMQKNLLTINHTQGIPLSCNICLYCFFFIKPSIFIKSSVPWPEKNTIVKSHTMLDCWLHTVWKHFHVSATLNINSSFWTKYFKLGFTWPKNLKSNSIGQGAIAGVSFCFVALIKVLVWLWYHISQLILQLLSILNTSSLYKLQA